MRKIILALLFFPSLAIADIQVQGYLNSAAFENLASDPSCAVPANCPDGRVYWNTTADEPRIYDGTTWVEMLVGTSAVPDPLLLGDNNATTPTYSFALDANTGMYRIGENDIGFSTGNELRLTLSDNGSFGATVQDDAVMRLQVQSGAGDAFLRLFAADGAATSDSVLEFGDSAVGNVGRIFYDHSVDWMVFYTGPTSSQRFIIKPTLIDSNVPFHGPFGAGATPTYSFDGDENTGMYSSGAGEVAFSTNNTERLRITATHLIADQRIHVDVNGSSAAPAYSFTGHTGTGLLANDNSLFLAVDGVSVVSINDDTQTMRIANDIGTEEIRFTGDAVATNITSESELIFFRVDVDNDNTGSAGVSFNNNNSTTFAQLHTDETRVTISATQAANDLCSSTVSGFVYLRPCSSSIRFKENVVDLPDDISSLIYDTVPRQFNWKEDNKLSYGFIAEEIDEILPELVTRNHEGQIQGIHHKALIPLMVAEMKKLRERIEALENQ